MKQKKPFWGSSQLWIAPLGLVILGSYTLNFQWCQPQGGFLNFVLSPPNSFVIDRPHLQCSQDLLK
jgi:hypothetical protein